MGNPLSYRDGMTMTWQNGRQLSSLQTEDNKVNYKYDSNGIRTQKTDNSGTTYYYYDSNNNLIGLTKGNDTLLFYYDSNDNVTSFKHNGSMYYYVKNLQGDVVKIINQAGVGYASYVYDAWGNIQSETGEPNIRRLNPFRYRGYAYDEETGLYYLQSRYYDPQTGRFLNADDTAFIGITGTVFSTNLFTYCENNSIMYVDYVGTYNIKNFNCYAYAFGINNRWMIPGQKDGCGYLMPNYYTVDQVVTWVTNTFGKNVRKLNGKNGKINKGEYRIAVKVCIYKQPLAYPYKYGPFYTTTVDFHFWKQDPKTQKWWDKPGSGNIRNRGNSNPDNQDNWYLTTYYYNRKMWYGTGKTFKSLKLYYNSKTVYLAYKGKFWSK